MKVIIDTREKNNIVELFKKEDVEIERQQLDVGDFLYVTQDPKKSTVIERKSWSDLKDSVMGANPRFFNQLINLRMNKDNYRVILLISGDLQETLLEIAKHPYQSKRFNLKHLEASINGVIDSILLDFQIPMWVCKDDEELVKKVINIFKKVDSPPGERPVEFKKAGKKLYQRQEDCLTATESVGLKTARKILVQFKTIKSVANATEKELQDALGGSWGRKVYILMNTMYSGRKK